MDLFKFLNKYSILIFRINIVSHTSKATSVFAGYNYSSIKYLKFLTNLVIKVNENVTLFIYCELYLS